MFSLVPPPFSDGSVRGDVESLFRVDCNETAGIGGLPDAAILTEPSGAPCAHARLGVVLRLRNLGLRLVAAKMM